MYEGYEAPVGPHVRPIQTAAWWKVMCLDSVMVMTKVCPMIFGSALKRVRHSPSLKTATGETSSAVSVARPIAALTPNLEKYAPSAASAATNSVVDDDASAG